MERNSFTQELKALAKASEEIGPGSCWREVIFLHRELGRQGERARRARRYLAHLPEVTNEGVLRVALADKVTTPDRSYATTARKDTRCGSALRRRPPHSSSGTDEGLLRFFESRRPGPLAEDLRRAVDELATLVAHDEAQRSGAP